MNGGKIAAVGLLVATVAAGGGMWYAQEYGYYDSIDPATVTLEVATPAGQQPLTIADVEAIDAGSSPLRWRACAKASDIPADAIPFPDATPLIGPRWFDCFDARQIGADLESGAARAVLSVEDIRPDVDRVLAIYPDGRVYGWHQYLDKTPERGVMD
ncbi:MAG: DUF6446 family protein [Paracoccus sp.]|nr:DUF6446 family protein [Paracoccus sp. (in: a-proteobacteria)]